MNDQERKKIEDAKIKPLADILEEFDFVIKVDDICGGHYWSNYSDDHRAKVRYIIDENMREQAIALRDRIIEKTYSYCSNFLVEPAEKAYPSFGDELIIKTKWEIIIKPHRMILNINDKRENTDKGIGVVVDVLKEYLHK